MPRPPTWSSRDDTRLREMWAAGVPVADIIAAFDRTANENAIWSKAWSLGIRRPCEP